MDRKISEAGLWELSSSEYILAPGAKAGFQVSEKVTQQMIHKLVVLSSQPIITVNACWLGSA